MTADTHPRLSPPKLPPLRDVIAAHGLQANKALGQNFLLDEQLLDRIAAIPGPLKDQPAFEVGPGPGGLTRAVLRAGARLVVWTRSDLLREYQAVIAPRRKPPAKGG